MVSELTNSLFRRSEVALRRIVLLRCLCERINQIEPIAGLAIAPPWSCRLALALVHTHTHTRHTDTHKPMQTQRVSFQRAAPLIGKDIDKWIANPVRRPRR